MSDTGETFHRIGLEQDNAELQRVNTELVWVVQDLISELREEAAAYRAHPVYAPAPHLWEAMADRAGARLKGLTDE